MDKGKQDIDTSKLYGNLVSVITYMVDMHDPTASNHQEEVALLARSIAEAMGHKEQLVNCVFLASQMHDVGKIAIPSEILSIPGKLNHQQQIIVMRHPQVSYEILKHIDFPFNVADVVYQHHERLDGSGYPQGLSGDQILLESRILAVADVVQAMSTSRSYHPSCAVDCILEELETHKGTLYDAQVVDTYRNLVTGQSPSGKAGRKRANN